MRSDYRYRKTAPSIQLARSFSLREVIALIAAISLFIAYIGQRHLSEVGNPRAGKVGVARAADSSPILVVTSPTSPFGAYYPEILRTEGLNAFDVMDISNVTDGLLDTYDLVVLAQMQLGNAEAVMFSNWVERGGNLIAMAPSPLLANLLGLSPTGKTLSDAYLLVDTATAVGKGIVNETIQFHGKADRYRLNGASSLAMLYATAATATENPAVTLHTVGMNGGQAAAFTYDLATSVVLTRQGNPAWAAQERDGFSPIRPNDKFYGAAAGDHQPDWVDPSKIPIPQADEQQRLLANLIVLMNVGKKPLPRFWYFPHGKRAVIVLTGDDHANGGTAGRFERLIAKSPVGCSLEKWECVRATSYIFPDTPLSDAQAARYSAQGFEVGLHINTGCRDYTPASLATAYREQLGDWLGKYRRVPSPRTQRHHCIVWSDWSTGAKVQRTHGMRLDVSYYFWPPGWARDIPGVFTGSAMPMRFADLDGTVIDVYGAATQMTDESGQSYPYTVDTLLDSAIGPHEYFGAYTVNAHTDTAQSDVADAVVESALRHGVPIVSSLQMLNWLEGRDRSSFHAIAWSGSALHFTVTPGAGATGLQTMLPMRSGKGVLGSITHSGTPVTFDVISVKGIEYAMFPAASGSYAATYGEDSIPPTVTRIAPDNDAREVDASATVNIAFSEPVDAVTVNASTVELRAADDALVDAKVAYDPSTLTATLTPSAPLQASTRYRITVKGGVTGPGIKDLAGNALAADATHVFSTGSGFLFPTAMEVAQPHQGRIHLPISTQADYELNSVPNRITQWKQIFDK